MTEITGWRYNETVMADIQDKLQDFFSKYRTRKYDKGQIVVFAGDEPGYVFYLIKGNVRMYDVSYRGEEIVANVFKPGAFFPMSWAINHTPNAYFFQAADEVEVALADPAETVAFLKENPDVMFDLLSRLYRGTDGMTMRMVQLMGGSARERLALELMIECKRFGKDDSNGACTLQMTESELAARAGLTRETVSRELRKLANENIVSIKQGEITLLDSKQLEAIAGKTV